MLIELNKRQGFTETESKLVDLLLEKEISGKTDKQIWEELGISQATFYRYKRLPHVANELMDFHKQSAKMLLPLAVEQSRKLLEDPTVNATAKSQIIKTVFQLNGLTKEERDTTAVSDKQSKIDIDDLMVQYGIKKAEV